MTSCRSASRDSGPLVSVIVPVYNTSATLEQCVASILSQTYAHLEIILIDDGSTDGSSALVDKLSRSDRRFQVIHQANQGLSVARNIGLTHAAGDFVTFVDSDDTIEPGLIDALVHQAITDRTKIAIASFARIFPDGHRQDFCPPSDPSVLSRENCLTRMLCEDGFTMSAWGKLYSRDLFDHVEFPPHQLYEDVGTTYRLILQCDRISFLPLALYNYYQNSTSIIHQAFCKDKISLIALTDQMCDDLTAQLVQSGSSSLSSDAEILALSDAIRKRRVHARLSILRQIVLTPHYCKNPHTRELVTYIRTHADDVLENPLSTPRDRLAIYSLRLGLPAFRLAWQLYGHLR